MCFGGGGGNDSPSTASGNPAPVDSQGNPTAVAAPTPAAPLPPPDEQDIGKRRKAEARAQFGQDNPTYRVRRDGAQPTIGPDGPIRM